MSFEGFGGLNVANQSSQMVMCNLPNCLTDNSLETCKSFLTYHMPLIQGLSIGITGIFIGALLHWLITKRRS